MTSLPSHETRAIRVQQLPLKGCSVEYIEDFLTKDEADQLYQLCTGFPVADHQVRIYGKMLNQPRQTCVLGVEAYTYSGLTLKNSLPIPKEINSIIDRMMLFLPDDHPRFNAILVNYYKDGSNYISPHSDSEAGLVPRTAIAGLSVGAVRHFDLSSKSDSEKHRIDLAHGSLIIMGAGTQDRYKHTVPVQKTVKQSRYNLTFRVSRGKDIKADSPKE